MGNMKARMMENMKARTVINEEREREGEPTLIERNEIAVSLINSVTTTCSQINNQAELKP